MIGDIIKHDRSGIDEVLDEAELDNLWNPRYESKRMYDKGVVN